MAIVKIGGREVDLTGVFPLKIRDWRTLGARGITREMTNDASDVLQDRIDVAEKIILYALQKVDPSITAEMLEDLTDAQLFDIYTKGAPTDPSSSGPSTTSPASTDGQ